MPEHLERGEVLRELLAVLRAAEPSGGDERVVRVQIRDQLEAALEGDDLPLLVFPDESGAE
jgi:hypothetical protein